jgi:hypothetical protein
MSAPPDIRLLKHWAKQEGRRRRRRRRRSWTSVKGRSISEKEKSKLFRITSGAIPGFDKDIVYIPSLSIHYQSSRKRS